MDELIVVQSSDVWVVVSACLLLVEPVGLRLQVDLVDLGPVPVGPVQLDVLLDMVYVGLVQVVWVEVVWL